MNFRDFLNNNIVILDGGMGTLLQEKGLKPGEHPEMWNLTHPEIITEIHKQYFDAGSNVVNTNTFGANPLKFNSEELDLIIKNAIENAKKAREMSVSERPMYISLDIGPTGKMLKPFGDLDFESAISIFSQIVKVGLKYGVDLVTIETMNDSYETKAAVLAVKENCDLPIIVTNAYGSDGKLMTGASPSAMVSMLEGLRVDALGANCSLGPKQLMKIAEELLDVSSLPVVIKPNAGLPKIIDGKTTFDVFEKDFALTVAEMCQKGVRVVGGCCGTTPAYIRELVNIIKEIPSSPIVKKNRSTVSSYSHDVCFGEAPILIGERINPTGKKRFKQALAEHDIDYILKEGITQQEKGVHILDVNVGLPEINEVEMLKEAVYELQAVTDLPLQIDTADPVAMEAAMRIYNGKPMVNSVNGKKESMNLIFPIVKKYGGLVVALTLDEDGIPNTVEGRLKIAKNIIKCAEEYGIHKSDLIFDPLAMTISSDKNAAKITMETLRRIRSELGCNTSLGISNVSFGLPQRDLINSNFFAMCLSNGLSAAIMNPFSVEMMRTYRSFLAISGLDDNCVGYIDFCNNPSNIPTYAQDTKQYSQQTDIQAKPDSDLKNAIIHGIKDSAYVITKSLIESKEPIDIIENYIIPALDVVGKGFENKTVYLPQLLMSAEAAKSAFDVVKEYSKRSSVESAKSIEIVIATVKGDIHDIGKNIVKLLLENYGYSVHDLGKDVDPLTIVNAVIEFNASVCCLSALMTTTVPAMAETIKLIRQKSPECKIMVGGAVLNQEYADMIGADIYAKDAMGAVRKVSEL